MTEQTKIEARPRNLRLAVLTEAEYLRLLPHLKRVAVKQGEILHKPATPPNSVYFFDEGIACLIGQQFKWR
jgi:hypothetical protein